MKNINYLELGGTLFVPATHRNLESITNGSKYPSLKSLVIDTEDGIDASSLQISLEIIKKLLLDFTPNKLIVFIRPKNVNVLQELLSYKGISKVDGFILPKFSLTNAEKYLQLLERFNYYVMPSIEGEELFEHNKLHKIKNILLDTKTNILLVRFGLQDMLRQLSMKQSCDKNVFDIGVTSSILGNFIATFKSAGFYISAGVYPCFENKDGFEKDVLRDLEEGLFSKTIIHPNQIDIINELYKVNQEEFDDALEIYESTNVIFKQNNTMAETLTMQPYSQNIIKRAEIYGLK